MSLRGSLRYASILVAEGYSEKFSTNAYWQPERRERSGGSTCVRLTGPLTEHGHDKAQGPEGKQGLTGIHLSFPVSDRADQLLSRKGFEVGTLGNQEPMNTQLR